MLESYQLLKNMASQSQKLRPLSETDIKKIQKILLDMMDDLDYLCREEGLTYFICGGTAIGAVRHHGYIPWDEDLDLCMPRKDYDRFALLVKERLSDKYWVQNICFHTGYDLNFMKIRKKGTRYVELLESDESCAGVFIDIFPIENTYNNPILRFGHGCIADLLLLISSCVRIHSKYQKLTEYVHEDRSALQLIQLKSKIGFLFSFFSLDKWLQITESWLSRCHNDRSRYITIPSGRGHFFGELYCRSAFFPPKDISFEKRHYYIMKIPDHYLSMLYGDYMTIPPVEKRERHMVVDINIE
ncbi:MAG: phosphorylcholine transferase LicD [Lachnospiraceae bacterium]